MSPGTMIIAQKNSEDAVQAAFVEHDQVIQALPAHLLHNIVRRRAPPAFGCAIHSAVGWAVTAKWTMRLRSCASTRNT